jgi:hypothetical protein
MDKGGTPSRSFGLFEEQVERMAQHASFLTRWPSSSSCLYKHAHTYLLAYYFTHAYMLSPAYQGYTIVSHCGFCFGRGRGSDAGCLRLWPVGTLVCAY